jgi:hypothetical protein
VRSCSAWCIVSGPPQRSPALGPIDHWPALADRFLFVQDLLEELEGVVRGGHPHAQRRLFEDGDQLLGADADVEGAAEMTVQQAGPPGGGQQRTRQQAPRAQVEGRVAVRAIRWGLVGYRWKRSEAGFSELVSGSRLWTIPKSPANVTWIDELPGTDPEVVCLTTGRIPAVSDHRASLFRTATDQNSNIVGA